MLPPAHPTGCTAGCAAADGLLQLRGLFDADRLAASTQLVDASGQLLREGCQVMMTAMPNGKMVVQGGGAGGGEEQGGGCRAE